ncbi:MAG: hypothetical protein RL120_01480, partial [Gammaproteobacteria bacterium]
MRKLIITSLLFTAVYVGPSRGAELNSLAGCSEEVVLARPGYAFLATRPVAEISGSNIGEVYTSRLPIFNEADPEENNALFRWVNRIHILTRAATVEQTLLFDEGDNYDTRILDETERLLRQEDYYHDVDIRPVRLCNG